MASTLLADNGVSSGAAGLKSSADGTGTLALQTTTASGTATTAVLIDNAQNVGVGVTPNTWSLGKAVEIGVTGAGFLGYGNQLTASKNAYYNAGWKYARTGDNALQFDMSSGQFVWYNAPSGTAGNAISFTQAMTLDASGNLLVGATSAPTSCSTVIKSVTANNGAYIFIGGYTTSNLSWGFQGVSGTGANAANTAFVIQKDATTNRSINAGGTVNASGADYAEYMTKAGDFAVAKGDVIGINAEGKLTNVFADAVSFCVKSTDPSYVGGDVWGNKEALGLTKPEDDAPQEEKDAFNAALEAARQTVDRIAFAGQVPVNVTGTTAGQFIVPINDNGSIKGEAVSNPTFEQYQQAVGKVIAIEQDGRARIIVKVA